MKSACDGRTKLERSLNSAFAAIGEGPRTGSIVGRDHPSVVLSIYDPSLDEPVDVGPVELLFLPTGLHSRFDY